MRRFLFLVALFTIVAATQLSAQQGGGDPAAMLQRMKDRIKPELIEKTKITDAQADKVIEINFAQQRQRRDIRMDQNLSEEDKTKRNQELDAARDKEYKGNGLTEEQVKSVNSFFEEMRKQQMQRRQNGGGGQQ